MFTEARSRSIVTAILLAIPFSAFAQYDGLRLPRIATLCAAIIANPNLDKIGKVTPVDEILIKMRNYHMAEDGLSKSEAAKRVLSSVGLEGTDAVSAWRTFDDRSDIEEFLESSDMIALDFEQQMASVAPTPFWTPRRKIEFAVRAALLGPMALALFNRHIQDELKQSLLFVQALKNENARIRIQNGDPDRVWKFNQRLTDIHLSMNTRQPLVVDDLGLSFEVSRTLLNLYLNPPREDADLKEVKNFEDEFIAELGRVLRGEFNFADRHQLSVDFKYSLIPPDPRPHLLVRVRVTNPFANMGPRPRRPDEAPIRRPRFWGETLVPTPSYLSEP